MNNILPEEANPLAYAIKQYKAFYGITDADIAAKMHRYRPEVTKMINKDGRAWNVGNLIDICHLVGMPPTQAIDIIENGICHREDKKGEEDA